MDLSEIKNAEEIEESYLKKKVAALENRISELEKLVDRIESCLGRHIEKNSANIYNHFHYIHRDEYDDIQKTNKATVLGDYEY